MSEPTLPFPVIEQPNPPPRPRQTSDKVLSAVAKSLVPDVVEWLEEDPAYDERSEIEEQLREALERASHLDGFQIARVLADRFHWDGVNTELVEVLDGASSYSWDVHQKLVAEWVAANGIQPKLRVGDTVKTPHGTGPISGIMASQGVYLVKTDEFLAKNPDQAKHAKGVGFQVAFEHCELVSKGETP